MDTHKHHMHGHGHGMETTTAAKHEHHVTEDVPYHVADENDTGIDHHMVDHDMHLNHDMHMNHDHTRDMHSDDAHLHHHDNGVDHSHHHAHPMTFHARNDDYILFSDWQLSPGKVTFFVCLALVLMAVLYQAIKMVRSKLGRKCPNTRCKRYILSKGHIMQTVFYVAQFAVGYMLMLAVMTYNVWVMTAAVVGIGLGYFFFGWAEYEEIVRLQPITMKFHARTQAIDCGQSGEQELLPLSPDNTSTDISIVTSNVACSCGDQDI